MMLSSMRRASSRSANRRCLDRGLTPPGRNGPHLIRCPQEGVKPLLPLVWAHCGQPGGDGLGRNRDCDSGCYLVSQISCHLGAERTLSAQPVSYSCSDPVRGRHRLKRQVCRSLRSRPAVLFMGRPYTPGDMLAAVTSRRYLRIIYPNRPYDSGVPRRAVNPGIRRLSDPFTPTTG